MSPQNGVASYANIKTVNFPPPSSHRVGHVFVTDVSAHERHFRFVKPHPPSVVAVPRPCKHTPFTFIPFSRSLATIMAMSPLLSSFFPTANTSTTTATAPVNAHLPWT